MSSSTSTPAASISGRHSASACPTSASGPISVRAAARWPAAMPASCSTRSTVSASRRASPLMVSPYFRTLAGSATTPSARLPAAVPMTDTGVRSSCETAATNSICWRASVCARLADTTMRPIAVVRRRRMPELNRRLLRRTVATAASSDPARCTAASCHRPSNAPRVGASAAVGGSGPPRRSCSTEMTMRSSEPGARRWPAVFLASIRSWSGRAAMNECLTSARCAMEAAAPSSDSQMTRDGSLRSVTTSR